jgi:hypothetical protein
MAVRESNRPYAYPGNIMDVLQRYRSLDLPGKFEPTDLSTAGVPEGNHGRTVFALKFIGLLNGADEPTQEWRALCDAGEDEFRAQLGALVRAAYADVFARVNPETDNQERVAQAFQPYTPKSQIERMVAFFLGMCREGGIPTLDAPKRRPTKAQSQRSLGSARPAPKLIEPKRTPKVKPLHQNGQQHEESNLLFGVSDNDIALLDDSDFQVVWSALGKVARARARRTVTVNVDMPAVAEDDTPNA